MNPVVLSGTVPIVPSGTRCSCYREPKFGLAPALKEESGDSNIPNRESNFVGERVRIRPAMALTFGQGSSNNKCSKCEFEEGSVGPPITTFFHIELHQTRRHYRVRLSERRRVQRKLVAALPGCGGLQRPRRCACSRVRGRGHELLLRGQETVHE